MIQSHHGANEGAAMGWQTLGGKKWPDTDEDVDIEIECKGVAGELELDGPNGRVAVRRLTQIRIEEGPK